MILLTWFWCQPGLHLIPFQPQATHLGTLLLAPGSVWIGEGSSIRPMHTSSKRHTTHVPSTCTYQVGTMRPDNLMTYYFLSTLIPHLCVCVFDLISFCLENTKMLFTLHLYVKLNANKHYLIFHKCFSFSLWLFLIKPPLSWTFIRCNGKSDPFILSRFER